MAQQKVAKIAGQDYCSVEEPEGSLSDLDVPGGVKVENGSGHAADNDPTRG